MLFLFLNHLRSYVLTALDPGVFQAMKKFILFSFSGITLTQLYLHWFLFRKTAVKKADKTADKTAKKTPPVSVVICARNEDDNLPLFLPSILNQNYPDFEVVVVNDCSFDHTAELLEEFAKKYSRLKIVTIKEDDHFHHGKKFALMCGIKGASHEIILLTDADCHPAGDSWIASMACNYEDEATEIVLGYGAFEKRKGILNKLIRFDTFFIALQYFSMALSGKPYMGVGRNLSYKKQLFFRNKGFASHYHLESGDDDLFINEAATSLNTRVDLTDKSFTYSRPATSFRAWFNQKRRHISTFNHYTGKSFLLISLVTGSQYLFWIFFALSLYTGLMPEFILSVFALRMISILVLFKKAMDRLGEKDLLLFSPLFEFFLLFMYPALSLSNIIIKKSKWRS